MTLLPIRQLAGCRRSRQLSAFCALLLTAQLPAQIGGEYQTKVRHSGAEADDWFGYSVANIPDLDGDQIPEYIIGAPYAKTISSSTVGSAYVYSGATHALLFQFDGNRHWDHFGFSVAAAGDVNGDGTEDIIIGAPRVDSFALGLSTVGAAYVFSGVNGGVLHHIEGTQGDENLGAVVCGAGDVNHDGFDDFTICSPGLNTFTGAARVYSGADGTVLYQFDGTDLFGQWGGSAANAGDVNGDGFPDILIGSKFVDGNGLTDAGMAEVYSGATGAILYTFEGTAYQSWLGWSLAAAGDVNADGFDDILIGAPGMHSDGLPVAGEVYLYSGATGLRMQTFKGRADHGYLGKSASLAGDLDGDGNADFAIGSPHVDTGGLGNSGAVIVFSSTGDLIHQFDGEEPGGWFGAAVSALGDVNGDGYAEILTGAYFEDGQGLLNSGSTHILGLNPFLAASSATVSASSGALLGLELDFPDSAANDEYKILLSGSTSGSFNFGVEIPLALDGWVIETFYGNYPFDFSTAMQGNLNANGDGSCSIGILPGSIGHYVGRTFRLAAIANKPGLLPEFSSVAIPVEIVL